MQQNTTEEIVFVDLHIKIISIVIFCEVPELNRGKTNRYKTT